MSTVDDLLALARTCYAKARVAISPETKRAFEQTGDDYLKEASERERHRAVVQAAFPKPDLKIGHDKEG